MNASPSSSRRAFLARVAVGLSAVPFSVAWASGIGTAASPTPAWNGRIDTLTDAIFEGVLGSQFRVHGAAGENVDLQLVQVRRLKARRTGSANSQAPAKREPFSILLHGRAGEGLPQDTYVVEHASLGSFKMFLVPVGPARSVVRYEAIFS